MRRRHEPSNPAGHEARDERRGRLRHGDVKAALLLALVEGPAHGYQLGQRLLRASGGAWQPSPGSIYPTLQALADDELVTFEEREDKRIYALTRRGHAAIKRRAEHGADAPWAAAADGGPLREAMVAIKMAAKQVGTVGSAEQRERATEILVDTRRRLYELLAQG